MGLEQKELSPAPGNLLKKTPKMEAVEAIVGNLPDFLQRSYYSEPEKRIIDVAQEISQITGGKVTVSETTVGFWLKKFGIPPKPTKEKKVERLRSLWMEPEKRVWMLSRLHTPEAEEKKRESLKSTHWSKNPAKRDEIKRKMEERKKESWWRRVKKSLGENPQQELQRLYWVEGLSPEEIGKKIGKRKNTVLRWMKKLGVERKPFWEQSKFRIRREKVKKAWENGFLEKLPARTQEILKARYLSYPPKALREIGKDLKVSFQRVNAIENSALKKIEKWLEERSSF